MRAVVYRGEGQMRVEDVPEPTISAPGDAIVHVRTAAICGSDLHILHGRVPGVFDGATVGHEMVGDVVAVGEDVTRFAVGDRVIGSFQISDGTCPQCQAGKFNLCAEMGTLGYGIFLGDLGGAQAEYVRVPYADVNLLAQPADVADESALWVGDVLTTGWYAALQADIVAGTPVLVVGAGPVGLCAAMVARHLGGEVIVVDQVADRLAVAERLGCRTINASAVDPTVALESLTDTGRARSVIESVGLGPALATALDCCDSGGTVSVIGVHTEFTAELPLQNMFARALRIHFGGSCNVQAVWEESLSAVRRGVVDPAQLVSHVLPLQDAVEGYRLFDAKQAMKVLLQVS
ncbi:MAG: alcohol dehydrogenase catalytic domain-containing protein [Mycobacteriales bacterium]